MLIIAAFAHLRRTSEITGPTTDSIYYPLTKQPFPVDVYAVETSDHVVKVKMPTIAPGMVPFLPTKERLANGLAVLPTAVVESVNQVVLVPFPRPTEAGSTHKTAATCGFGKITVYPGLNWDRQAYVDSTIIHEGVHCFREGAWAHNEGLAQDWDDAIRNDQNYPSEYAKENAIEDFSESAVMYLLSKGTECEKLARSMYPNRYAVLDRLMGKRDPFVPLAPPGHH